MPTDSFSNVKREAAFAGVQTSGAASTSVVHGILRRIEGVPLDDFESLLVHLDVSVGSTGGPWDLYLQVPLVPDPAQATDAHWQDLFHFVQSAAGSTADQVGFLPVKPLPNSTATGGSGSSDAARPVEQQALAADAAVCVPFVPDQIRVVSRTGAGVTVAATFSLNVTGSRRRIS